MQKKGVEVYFALYLATIISFFALEGEIVKYKKSQALLLLDMAQDKIKTLVSLDHSFRSLEDDTLVVELKLTGEFESADPNSIGKAVFTPDSSPADSVKFDLFKKKDAKNWYYMKTPLSVFGSRKDSSYSVRAELGVNPLPSEALKKDWLQRFKKEKIVNTLFENIEQISPLAITKKLPYSITPTGAGPTSDFTMNFADEEYSVIKGLDWEYPLFIGGVRENDDFNLRMIEGSNLCTIQKNTPETILKGRANRSGTIIIRGTRQEDYKTVEARIKLNVVPPQWRNRPDINEIYIDEVYKIDGRVEGIEAHQTKLQIWGTLIRGSESIAPVSTIGPFPKPGSIKYQAVVNGVPIEELTHTINVVLPPPPDIVFLNRENNKLIFTVTCYGNTNGIKALTGINNVANIVKYDHNKQNNRNLYKVSVDIQKPVQLTKSNNNVTIEFMIIDNLNKRETYNGRFIYFLEEN